MSWVAWAVLLVLLISSQAYLCWYRLLEISSWSVKMLMEKLILSWMFS